MSKILTLKEARANALSCWPYANGDYAYKTDGYCHLIRNGVDLLKGLNATDCDSYPNGDYRYQTGKYWHLIRNGVDLLEGMNATECWSHDNGDYRYKTGDGEFTFIESNKESTGGHSDNANISGLISERGHIYGDIMRNAETTQSLMDTLLDSANSSELMPMHRECLHMICAKLSRMANGDPMHADNARDIAGYATLLFNWIESEKDND